MQSDSARSSAKVLFKAYAKYLNCIMGSTQNCYDGASMYMYIYIYIVLWPHHVLFY